MDTSVLSDTVAAVAAVASSGFDWKWLIHRLIASATDPAVMVYIAAGVAAVVAWIRSILGTRKQAGLDAVVWAFGNVEKAASLVPAKRRAAFDKGAEFANLFTQKYREITGVTPSARLIADAVAQAAKLALEKKLRGAE